VDPIVFPLVSIVTPSLNMARYLPEAIEAFCPRLSKIEYIVVDGGSTDGTEASWRGMRIASVADRQR